MPLRSRPEKAVAVPPGLAAACTIVGLLNRSTAAVEGSSAAQLSRDVLRRLARMERSLRMRGQGKADARAPVRASSRSTS